MAGSYAKYSGLGGSGGGGGGGVTSLNGEVGAVNIVAGSGITVTPLGQNISIAATGGGGTGTVTSVSVVSANGLAGMVATATTTPAITLSTTVTGLLQGNGTAISAATTGNLTDVGTDGIVITGGTGAVLGAGTSIAQQVANTTDNGYLSSTDWNTFNSKIGPADITKTPNTFAGFDGAGLLETIPNWSINTLTGGVEELITLSDVDTVGGQNNVINNFQNTFTPTADLVNLSYYNMQNYAYLNSPFNMNNFTNINNGISVSDIGNKGNLNVFNSSIFLGDSTNIGSSENVNMFNCNINVNDNHTNNQNIQTFNTGINIADLGVANQVTAQSIFYNIDGTVNSGVQSLNIGGNFNSAQPVNVGYNGINHSLNFNNTLQYYNGILSGGNFQTGAALTNNVLQFQDNGHFYTGASSDGYTSYAAFPNFDLGSTINGYGGMNISPNFNGSLNSNGINGYGLNFQSTVAANYINGFGNFGNLNSGASVTNGVQSFTDNMNIHSGAAVSFYTSFSAGPNFQSGSSISGSYQGLNVNPQFDINATNIQLAYLDIHGSGTITNLTGLQINLNQVTCTTQKQGLVINDGNIQVQGNYDTAILPASPGFINIHGIGGLFRVAPGFPVTNTLTLSTGLGVSAVFEDDYGPDAFVGNLAFGNINLSDQAIVAAGKTVAAYNQVLVAISLPPGSAFSPPITDTGTIIDAFLLRMPGMLAQGGSPAVTNMYQIYMDNIGGSAVAANAWGLYIADPALENYFKSSIAIDTASFKVTNSSVGLEIGSTTKALLLSNLTTTQRNALTALAGMEIFNTTTNQVEYYNGTVWVGPGGGGSTQNVEYHTVTSGEETAKAFALTNTPLVPANVICDIISGGPQQYSVDFTIIGSNFDWNGLGLDGLLSAGDIVRLNYLS